MASRSECAARPLTTDAERAALRAEMAEYRRKQREGGVPECLRWLQRQALLLSPEADKPEFLSLIQDAIARFSEA